MKRILIYGDSNTWGQKAYGGRYSENKQWPNILQELLGDGIKIIQEGLPGRIAGDHIKDKTSYKNGKTTYEAILRSAIPVDIVIIALGTNDIKNKYSISSKQICKDLSWYSGITEQIHDAKSYGFTTKPIFLFVGIANLISSDYFTANFESRNYVNAYLKNHTNFISLDDLEHTEDGIHYSEQDHKKVAEKVYEKIQEVL